MSRFIRILPKPHYFKDLGRFSSLAFKNTGDSISVIAEACVSESGWAICSHLAQYYMDVDSPPFIIWRFNDAVIPATASLIQEDSTTGDKCHYGIHGVSSSKAKRILNDHFEIQRDAEICDNSIPRRFTPADYIVLEEYGSTRTIN